MFAFLGGNQELLIEKIGIYGLFGYQNFEYNFTDKNTVFVGENGMGKTTILSILYHTLSLNFKDLDKYDFEKISIKYEDSDEIFIKKEDIEGLSKLYPRKAGKYSVLLGDIEEILNKISGGDFSILSEMPEIEVVRKVRNQLIHYNVNIPLSSIRELYREYMAFNKSDGVYYDFTKTTKARLLNTKILYFPTYRRIEEDILNLEQGEDEIRDYYIYSEKSKIRKRPNAGELIQFGMNDVAETIQKLLNTIKETSIESFNQMTGELLAQYLDNKVDSNVQNNITKQEIKISLDRVGSKIDSELKNRILLMFDTNQLDQYPYLKNLIYNLVSKNKNLESIDTKINNFVETCNRYLYDKKFVYNPSEVTLDIELMRHDATIKLSDLSSGEKQLVSTFSKIFLEDNEKILVLFDEPELSLSIEWQENFIYDISKSDNCCFLVSVTHSPFIFKRSEMLESAKVMADYITEVEVKNED
ncbi:hypothetical protein EFO35_06790 [Lactococcus cremoris]|nr:hypothetical protein [Lactococcus cremoris]